MSSTSPGAANEVATVIITVETQPNQQHVYLAWQKRMNDGAAKYTGFMDSEVIMPEEGEDACRYTNVYRFASSETLKRWLESEDRREMMAQIEGRWADVRQVAAASQAPTEGNSTLVVSHDVPADGVHAFLVATDAIQKIQATYPGYLGVKLLEPVPGVQPQWTSLIRFDTKAHLQNWANSTDRKAALAKLNDSGTKYESQIVGNSFGSWFSFNMKDGIATPNWKQWLMVLLALYPTVMLLGYLTNYLPGGSQNTEFPLPEWFFANMWIGNFLSTLLLSFAIMPGLSRMLQWWLSPRAATAVTIWGTLLVVGLFIVSTAVFGKICHGGCLF
jgi:antibiotic biosynthesis monooxygenase (ABM) superfamily enzyme